MTAHTQGRLVVAYAGNEQHRLVIANNEWSNGLFITDGTFYPDDARRLAACWNYFDDSVSTTSIEADSYAEMRSSFVRQRDELKKANANLGYYQRALSLPEAPQYWVEGGGLVPTVQPVRVAALADELAAARALLAEMLARDEAALKAMVSLTPLSGADKPFRAATERIRAFLKGGA